VSVYYGGISITQHASSSGVIYKFVLFFILINFVFYR